MKSKFIATLLLSGFVSCTISLKAIAQQIPNSVINAQPKFSLIASSVRLPRQNPGTVQRCGSRCRRRQPDLNLALMATRYSLMGLLNNLLNCGA